MAKLTDLTTTNYDELILRSKGPVLIDFWATWCGPCQQLGTKLEEIAQQLGPKATIVKVNIEEQPALAQKFGIRGVPSLMFLKNGETKKFLSGNPPKEAILSELNGLM